MRSLVSLILIFSSVLNAEEVTVSKINDPVIVTVDRRPEKNVVYTRCFGDFVFDRFSFETGVKPLSGDRICPNPSQVQLNVDKVGQNFVRATTDRGETVAELATISEENFEKLAQFRGRSWEFLGVPSKVTVKVPSTTSPPSVLSDTVYMAIASSKDSDDFVQLVCDDASTLQACFDSRIQGKKPLAMGDSKSTPHFFPANTHGPGAKTVTKN